MEKKLTFEQLPTAVEQLSQQLKNIERLLTQNKERKQSENNEQLLTVQQTAKFLNLTVPTIYSKVSKGELPVMKRSKRLYFSSIELINYLKVGKRKSNSEIENDASTYLSNSKNR